MQSTYFLWIFTIRHKHHFVGGMDPPSIIEISEDNTSTSKIIIEWLVGGFNNRQYPDLMVI